MLPIYAILNNKFRDCVKLPDLNTVHTKKKNLPKNLIFPLESVLPLLAKILNRVNNDQLSKYMDRFLNKLLCRFRKAHSTHHTHFSLLQRWQNEARDSGTMGTILMDFSLAYDCLPMI